MCKTNRLHKWLNFSVAIGIAAFGLIACGGGGGGGGGVAAPSPTTKPAGVTYNVFIDNRISEGSITFDIDGRISDGTTTITLAPTANGGCSFTSNPSDSTLPVCSTLPNGAGYLLCANNTTGETFDSVLFNKTVVDASVSEVVQLTLAPISCGTRDVRTVIGSAVFNAQGDLLVKSNASGVLGTQSIPASFSAAYFSTNGQISAGRLLQRFVLKKIVQTNKTTYFLLNLTENPTGQIFPPSLFMIEVPH
jgi:hypothetical protein